MGYNFSGIAIDKDLSNNLQSFFHANGMEIIPTDEELTIDEAMEGDQASDEIDVFFTEKGTLIFISQDISLSTYVMPGVTVLNFDYYEITMAFSIILSSDGKKIRDIMEVEGEIKSQTGTPHPLEDEFNSLSGLIPALVKDLTGFGLFTCEGDEPCRHYKLKAKEEIPKKWWEFWK